MARGTRDDRTTGHRPRVRTAALVVAGVFVLVGLLGFVPGVTTGYDEMTVAGHGSGAKLLGLFQVSVLHNAVHLLFGLVGLVLARSVAGARVFLAVGGAVYLALWLYGLVLSHGETPASANVLPVNAADNWLHLGLGFGMLLLGLLLSPGAGATAQRLDRPFDRP
ncbi:hypothetical protein AWW66_03025 [Micromonospora rosaria]|uniref:DUF4383 domain-containing protein n=1 Tax=Micromonospora rosaria TaxID=47874 RepID=A0A136PYK3_9ACTN|nr:DUF4383 domain-containing protein [Micromonospora rosaria]KXK63525.1 hypothetical protein AWW66_03025 [Micromonospora rosaria]